MLGKLLPTKTEYFLGKPIVTYTDWDGSRKYELPDGRIVYVWQDFSECRRCGRPLKDPISRRLGFGQCCRRKSNPFSRPIVYVQFFIPDHSSNTRT